MKSLTIEQTRQGQTLNVRLEGQIDEEADYTAVPVKGIEVMVFDFEKVRLINSTGLQRWIKFFGSIDKTAKVSFTRCAIRVITQINMFPGFFAGRPVKIDSFFAPYFCAACDKSCDVLLDLKAHGKTLEQLKAPKTTCPTCGGHAEFDGIEKKYFMFLKPT